MPKHVAVFGQLRIYVTLKDLLLCFIVISEQTRNESPSNYQC
jgi:hypothetical protein